MLRKIVFGFFLIVLTFLGPTIDGEACHGSINLSKSYSPSGVPINKYEAIFHGKRRRQNEIHDRGGYYAYHHDDSSWNFNYRDIEEWKKHYPQCAGAKQSPVDLNSELMVMLRVKTPLSWFGYDEKPTNMTIENTGHSVQLNGIWENGRTPYLSGGTLVGNYEFHQLHFHWGSIIGTGSEHTIRNISLPLEMHMVHYKKEYGSMEKAMTCDDGLAVIAVFFKIGKLQNSGLRKFGKSLREITSPGTKVNIKPFPLSKFRIGFRNKYVSYLGSLTTPPCTEIVTWIVRAISNFMSKQQINMFRSIQLADADDHNYRPTMPLNGRLLYYVNN